MVAKKRSGVYKNWVMVVLVGAGVKWVEKDYTRPPYQAGGVDAVLSARVSGRRDAHTGAPKNLTPFQESVKTVVVPSLS